MSIVGYLTVILYANDFALCNFKCRLFFSIRLCYFPNFSFFSSMGCFSCSYSVFTEFSESNFTEEIYVRTAVQQPSKKISRRIFVLTSRCS